MFCNRCSFSAHENSAVAWQPSQIEATTRSKCRFSAQNEMTYLDSSTAFHNPRHIYKFRLVFDNLYHSRTKYIYKIFEKSLA